MTLNANVKYDSNGEESKAEGQSFSDRTRELLEIAMDVEQG